MPNVDNQVFQSNLIESGPKQAPGDQNDEIGVVLAFGWQAYGRFGPDFNGHYSRKPVLAKGFGKISRL